jgi:hypothetical protein
LYVSKKSIKPTVSKLKLLTLEGRTRLPREEPTYKSSLAFFTESKFKSTPEKIM